VFWFAVVLIGFVSRLRLCSWLVSQGFQNQVVFSGKGFGKNTSHPFSAGVLVSVKLLRCHSRFRLAF
jgi:hypothetical protein